MKSLSFLQPIISPATHAAFEKTKRKYILRVLVVSSVVIYFIETFP